MLPTPPTGRCFALLGLAALAGCAAPVPDAVDDRAPDIAVVRGQAVGLSAVQAQRLLELGPPVLLPARTDGFEVVGFSTEEMGPFGGYSVRWQRPSDGACFRVEGVTDGLGGPEYPLVSLPVTLRELPGRPTVRLYQAADDPLATSAQNWGPGAVVSEPVELDGMTVLFGSTNETGCRPLALREAGALLAGLRPLVPGMLGEDDDDPLDADLGAFWVAEDVIEEASSLSGSDPEAAARSYFAPWATDGARLRVQTLRRTADRAVVLVTLTGLADDSVRDERLRLLYERSGPTWVLADAGRQVRCQPGRGHPGWEASLCR